MWADFIEWGQTHLLTTQPQLVSADDLKIPHCVNTAEEAVAVIREHHAIWQAKGQS